MNHAPVICPHHNVMARFRLSSAHIYRGFDYGSVWECPVPDCDSYVGCHPDGRPLGRLANKELRIAKRNAHDAFDALWRGLPAQRSAYPEEMRINKKLQGVMRGRAYHWLSEQLGIIVEETHIGMFDVDQCKAVIRVIETLKPTPTRIRDWYKDNKHRFNKVEQACHAELTK